jgi:trimeric autotransporter adhesin
MKLTVNAATVTAQKLVSLKNTTASLAWVVSALTVVTLFSASPAEAACSRLIAGTAPNLFVGESPPNTGNYNTSVGCGALENNSGGANNTATGGYALRWNTTGSGNTASGTSALSHNTQGSFNTANGVEALAVNTLGYSNTATGFGALANNSSGNWNVAIGADSARALDDGNNNIAIGYEAGVEWDGTRSNNIAIGAVGSSAEDHTIRIGTVTAITNHPAHTSTYIAGIRGVSVSSAQMVVIDANGKLGSQSIPSGGSSNSDFVAGSNNNTASGHSALYYSQVGYGNSGANNTATGYQSMYYNTTGSDNVASGNNAMLDNTIGSRNTASGSGALSTNTTGGNNVAVGYEAAKAQTVGSENTAVGYQAGLKWTTGRGNVAIGAGAGLNQVAGSNNVAISAPGLVDDTATIRIGKKDIHNKTFIAGIRNTTLAGGLAVLVNQNGKLGVATSSSRYKQDIKSMGDASNPLLQLRPVTFRYKQAEEDGSRPMQYGLIAEEVAAVMPELAVYNDDGSPESVAYQVLPSLLLNEYQKQNKELKETKAKLEAMEAEMASLKLMVLKLASVDSTSINFTSAP